jgi:hypothetical protein
MSRIGAASSTPPGNPRLLMSVRLSGNQTIGTSTTTPIQYDTVIVDNLNTFDATTYTFTAPYEDWFGIGQATTINQGSSTVTPIVALTSTAGPTVVKNGFANPTTGSGPTLVGLFHADEGETFQVTIQNLDSGNTITVNPGQPSTYWDIYSVGSGGASLPVVGQVFYPTVNVSYADIASGGIFVIQQASSPTATYKIINMFIVGVGSDGWATGDRDIAIWDGTKTFGLILSDMLYNLNNNETGALINNDFVTSGSEIRIDTGVDLGSETTPGADLIISYYTGAADYDAGTLRMGISYVQMTL